MSFVTTVPELLLAAAGQLQAIGSAASAANGIAAFPTTGVIPAAADEVSVVTAASFSAYGQQYQAISAEASMIHERFVDALRVSADSYATTEAANATQAAGGHVAPTNPLWHGGGYGSHVTPYGRGNYGSQVTPYGRGNYGARTRRAAQHVAPAHPAPAVPAQHVAPARPAPAPHVAPAQQVAQADLAPTAAVQHVSPGQLLPFAPPEHRVALPVHLAPVPVGPTPAVSAVA